MILKLRDGRMSEYVLSWGEVMKKKIIMNSTFFLVIIYIMVSNSTLLLMKALHYWAITAVDEKRIEKVNMTIDLTSAFIINGVITLIMMVSALIHVSSESDKMVDSLTLNVYERQIREKATKEAYETCRGEFNELLECEIIPFLEE